MTALLDTLLAIQAPRSAIFTQDISSVGDCLLIPSAAGIGLGMEAAKRKC